MVDHNGVDLGNVEIPVSVTADGRGLDVDGTIIEFGTYVALGGAWSPSTAEEGRDIYQADIGRIEASPDACGIEVGSGIYYFDADLVSPEPIKVETPPT